MPIIKHIRGLEILDSRGNPTVQAVVVLDDGVSGKAMVPSGASTGTHEAVELRDHDPTRFSGNGVLTAVNHINTVVSTALEGKDLTNQHDIDQILINLDGTHEKSKLGANALLAVSIACSRAGASTSHVPLYAHLRSLANNPSGPEYVTPLFNMLNGGMHSNNGLSFQEFLVIPPSAISWHESLRIGATQYQTIKRRLRDLKQSTGLGDEGGFAPVFQTDREALEFLTSVTAQASSHSEPSTRIGLDCASNSYHERGMYRVKGFDSPMSEADYVSYLDKILEDFSIALIEDPLPEDAWEAWSRFTAVHRNHMVIVGDDLLVTHPDRVGKAIEKHCCNAVLIKPNQIGTVSETLAVIRQAKGAGMKVIISHRSGETTDDFIADLAVGTSADFVKFGAPARGERVAKYNRLTEIYEEIRSGNPERDPVH